MSPRKHQESSSPLASESRGVEIGEFPILWRPPVDAAPHGPEVILLEKGHISPAQLREAVIRQQREARQSSILEVLVKSQVISEALATQAVAAYFKLPSMQLDVSEIDGDTFAMLPENYIRTKLVVPIRREGNEIVVGISYPADMFLINDIKRLLKVPLRLIVVRPDDIRKIADELQVQSGQRAEEIVRNVAQDDVEIISDEKQEGTDLGEAAGEGLVIQYVNGLISSAVSEAASDIHIEPGQGHLSIRYRIDGVLHEQSAPPLSMHQAIVSRIKTMANLDIAERRLPQDGRIQVKVQGKTLDLRVSTVPFMRGEKCVIRVLDSRSASISLDQLGMDSRTLETFRRQVLRPHGIVLVTGPTGSGKTATLYASLRMLEDSKPSIATIEDPVEYELECANQLNVREDIGLTFVAALRSFLRQDPDVILVGEIRDEETARVAMRASLTGRLVFSTLHTNDAPSAITRLVNMGVEPHLIGASVSAILAQRLVRQICMNCKEPVAAIDSLVAAHLEECGADAKQLRHGAGCDQCRQTGYKGRTGLFELLELDDDIRSLIVQHVALPEFRRAVREKGMRSLREDGLQKVRDGITTIDEVVRVTEL